jgi:hypothetical protein
VSVCSYRSNYWNSHLAEEVGFQCKNEKGPESDECIFHDINFHNKISNRKTIEDQFQKKIHEHLLSHDNEPLFCIGYYLYDVILMDKKFSNAVHFDKAHIAGLLQINSKFLNQVSFNGAVFIGGDVNFSNSQFIGEGGVFFDSAEFSGNGDVDFSKANSQEKAMLISLKPNSQEKVKLNFMIPNFSKMETSVFMQPSLAMRVMLNLLTPSLKEKGAFSFPTLISQEMETSFSLMFILLESRVEFFGTQFLKEGNVFLPMFTS